MQDARALYEELLIRDALDAAAARDDFLSFYRRMTGFTPPRHIATVCKLLQAMEGDKVDRAMVFMPPRHGKTLLCSRLFPAWIIGRRPTTYLMIVTHTATYSSEIGRAIRNYLLTPEWPFRGVELAMDSRAADRWKTSVGGELNGFGSLAGNQHGRPADWLILDDVIKGREMAMSPEQRGKVWANYVADMRSRLQGRRKQLLTFTRWHDDDLAGRILPEKYDGRSGWVRDRDTGEPWYVLCLPAQAERDDDPLGRAPGDWLWPEAFGEKELGPERARGGYLWASLYQQRPSPEEGLMFKADHFQRYDPSRIDVSRLTIYGSSDYAVTSDVGSRDPDWTVHLVWGVDEVRNLFLLDWWRGRAEPDVWGEAWIKLVKAWKPLQWAEEGGVILNATNPILRRLMQEHGAWTARQALPSTANKEMRAQPLLMWCGLGRVFVPDRSTVPPAKGQVLDEIMAEVMQFPTGRHDDAVDAMSLMGRLLDRMVAGKVFKPKSPHGETLSELFQRHEDSGVDL